VIVVGGALAVASVGYGLGTQADDGTAVAGGDQSSEGKSRGGGMHAFVVRGQPPGFENLADTLGVDADELEQALRDFHESERGDRRDEFAATLAKALGISSGKVSSALEQLHQRHEARFGERLAKALGVDADKVQAALDKITDDGPAPLHEFEQALADELGVAVGDVRKALFESRPEPGRMHRHRDVMPLRQLASALGVTRAELRSALHELRSSVKDDWEEHSQALAKFLADRFNLSADDVSKALDELPRPAAPGRGDRPGPGGPGPGPGFGGPWMVPAPHPG
jgi:transcriptional regulator with XRE-family HTH domain